MGVTIGIPVYNEGSNLIRLLKQIYKEHHVGGVEIDEVIIVDDSTDETPDMVNSYISGTNTPYKITYIHNNRRMGVAHAWNTIFRKAYSDIIILYDADIILGKGATKALADAIKSDDRIGIAGGRVVAINNYGIAATAAKTVSEWLNIIREAYPESQFTIMGRCISIRSDLARKIEIPLETISVDLYLQCAAKSMGYKVKYIGNAVVYFKPPTRIREFTSQILRGYIGHRQLKKLIEKYLDGIGIRVQIATFLEALNHTPSTEALNTFIAYILSAMYIARTYRGASRAQWDIALSTKQHARVNI